MNYRHCRGFRDETAAVAASGGGSSSSGSKKLSLPLEA